MAKDWSLTVWGDSGPVSIRHSDGLTSETLPVIAPRNTDGDDNDDESDSSSDSDTDDNDEGGEDSDDNDDGGDDNNDGGCDCGEECFTAD